MSRYVCPTCEKTFANRHSLCRHKNHNCRGKGIAAPPDVGQKRPHVSSPRDSAKSTDGSKGAFSPLLSSRYDKNPKIQRLVDAVINDDTSKSVEEKEKKQEVGDTSYPEKTLFDEILSDDSMMKKEKEKQEFLSDEEESSSDYTESLPPPPDEDVIDSSP